MGHAMRWVRRSALLLALLSALVVTGCGDDGGSAADEPAQASNASEPVQMTMAINPWIGYGPWYIAKEKGFDEANGVRLEFVNFVKDKDLAAAVASGRLDSSHALVSSALRHQAAGVPLRTVLFQDVSREADAIVAHEGIDSVEALAGRKVGFEDGGGGHALFVKALERAGMTLDDVEPVNIPAAEAGAALLSGKIDAAATYEPYLTELRKRGTFTTLATAGDFPGIISDIWQVADRFAREHPDTVVGALKAWDEGVRFFETNRSEALEILAAQAKTDVETQALELDGVELFDAARSLEFLREDWEALATDTAEIQRRIGGLDAEVDLAGLVDTSFLERAVGAD